MTEAELDAQRRTSLTVNGEPCSVVAEDRTCLADALRDQLLLTGTHLGCEHGVCGACTVLVDGEPVRSCITLLASCEGRSVTTVEGLSGPEVEVIKRAFSSEHGLQCGFCTPGMLVSARDIIRRNPEISPEEAAVELSGNICRCTGYVGIVRAVCRAAKTIREGREKSE